MGAEYEGTLPSLVVCRIGVLTMKSQQRLRHDHEESQSFGQRQMASNSCLICLRPLQPHEREALAACIIGMLTVGFGVRY